VALLTLRWLKKQGGVTEMEKVNMQKAALLYNILDKLPLFKGLVKKEDRSMMNAVFVIEDAELEKQFLLRCQEEGMVGIKGHRTVGGFRVSMYNALPLESVKALTDLMTDFVNRKG
jgi:phosphoserine aminotransferase